MEMKGPIFMLKHARRFKIFVWAVLLTASAVLCPSAKAAGKAAAEPEYSKNETGLLRDFFEQNIFYDTTRYLRFDYLSRTVTGKKLRAAGVNIYDEVPDNTFFTNRHARTPMTAEEMARGYRENEGPDAAGSFHIYKGRFAEFNSRVFAKDSRGGAYLLKFDPLISPEIGSGAEMIASRIYYALGYSVPQNTLVVLKREQIQAAPDARVVDSSGFKRKLTPDKLERSLLSAAQNEEGNYRAVASKLIEGDIKGGFAFQGRRRNDPDDPYDHETRREIRALKVFGAWLNHTDLRSHNSIDVVVEQDGKKILKHYLVDMDAALGAESHGAKPANFGHEHFIDYGETLKAIMALGLLEKPWQRRWREVEHKEDLWAAGYFDNRYFEPQKFKTQLPHLAFKDLTLADGFWAAKLIMNFTDEQIAAIVKTAEYSDPEVTETVTRVLTERRDIIGRYWFTEANPLDAFELKDGKLTFLDLGVKYGFFKAEDTVYYAEVFKQNESKKNFLISTTSKEPFLSLESSWNDAVLKIRISRSSGKPGPWVLVSVKDGKITGIKHQD